MSSKLNRKKQPAYKQVENIHFPPIEIVTLNNGIPVHILHGGTQELCKLDLMYSAGSRFSKSKPIPPFTSQMLNEGTKSFTAHQIAECFDFYGAYYQPIAEKDNSWVNLLTLNKHAQHTIPMMAATVNESSFPQKELEVMISRKRNNFLVESEKTAFVAREEFFKSIYGDHHPYGRTTKLEDYDAIKRDDLVQFFSDYYTKGPKYILASGQIDNQIVELLNQQFGHLDTTVGKNTDCYFEPEQRPVGRIEIVKEGAVQSSIRMGCITVTRSHPDYIPLKIITTILGGYFGSRLMKNIREEKGYTYGIHAVQVSLVNSGYLVIAADVKGEHTAEAITEIFAEMEKLRNKPVSKEELSLVRNFMLGELLSYFDGPLAISDIYKPLMEQGLGFEYYNRLIENIKSITAKQLQDVAQRYYKAETMHVVSVGVKA